MIAKMTSYIFSGGSGMAFCQWSYIIYITVHFYKQTSIRCMWREFRHGLTLIHFIHQIFSGMFLTSVHYGKTVNMGIPNAIWPHIIYFLCVKMLCSCLWCYFKRLISVCLPGYGCYIDDWHWNLKIFDLCCIFPFFSSGILCLFFFVLSVFFFHLYG